jgi:transposase
MGKSIQKLCSVTRVGLNLATRVFQVHAVDADGEIVAARKLTRSRLVGFFSELPRCVVAMEACPSAHHWGRQLLALGFEVRLIPPAHVKPYVRRNKNDSVDAAAICEAAGRPGQRFVPVRSIDNQAAVMRHRVREQLVGQRTALLNTARASERDRGGGGPGARHACRLKRMMADANGSSATFRPPAQIDVLDQAIAEIDEKLIETVKAGERARRLMTIPGVGPVIATASSRPAARSRPLRNVPEALLAAARILSRGEAEKGGQLACARGRQSPFASCAT